MIIKFLIALAFGILPCSIVHSQRSKVDDEFKVPTAKPSHRENEAWWRQRHQAKKALKDSMEQVDLIFIGDSITHSWESKGKEVWEKYYSDRNALNLGFSGDRTEHVLWRLQHDAIVGISPKVAVVMIGTNNTGHKMEKPENVAEGVKKIVEQLRSDLPETNILLLAIFPRDKKARGLKRKNNESINEIISKLDAEDQVIYLNINKHFLAEDGSLSREIMPDYLHPNAKGYQIWAEAMEPTLKQLMNED